MLKGLSASTALSVRFHDGTIQCCEKAAWRNPGLLEPFKISNWWLVVRLSATHRRPSPIVADQMCREMLNAWIAEETTSTLMLLADEFQNFRVS